jgi:hypothetical protein
MIAGHIGLAAGVKASQRRIPLWTLMLATVWLDVIFIPFLALGIETTETIGEGGSTPSSTPTTPTLLSAP